MESSKPWALTGLVIGPLLLASNVKSSFAIERTGHSAAIVLAFVGASLVLFARVLARRPEHHTGTQKYTAIPLEDVGTEGPSRSPSPTIPDGTRAAPSARQLRIAFVLLVVALCVRVETLRRIVGHPECSGQGYSIFLPLAFATMDYWTVQRHQPPLYSTDSTDEYDDSVYDGLMKRWARSNLRFIVPCAVLTCASALVLRLDPTPGSTFICPAVTLARHSVAISRILALPLDFCILYCVDRILQASSHTRKSTIGRPLTAVGYASLISSFLILMTGVIYFIFSPDDRSWMLSLPAGFNSSIVHLAVLASLTTLSFCLAIASFEVIIPTTIVAFVVTTAAAISSSWRHTQPFPPVPQGWIYILYSCTLIGFASLLTTQTTAEEKHRGKKALFTRTPGWFYGVLIVIFTTWTIVSLAHASNANFHPIDMLVFEAKAQHTNYVAQACSSRNLMDAVENYKTRYKRHPPPGFDKWYEYATTRNARIIDDFDRIHEDLMPYWTVAPTEIRQRTWQAIANPWNDVAGISVRNGTAEISPNVMPTHRWMLDGVIAMISHFGDSLPDMDLGFNLNDECRISVPYEDIHGMRKKVRDGDHLNPGQTMHNIFSDNRAEEWALIPAEPLAETPFRELSFQRTWSEFSTAACPPGSLARKQRYWDTGHLCTSCTAPHSLGAFLANWTVSADMCHQPDMANLHGLYLSPAAFKASHELYPVFSQSKAPGYNDILYPSPWNYMDKVKYDPNEEFPEMAFEKKAKTLFWRGATSEGVSPGSGTWKGMSRQRFVHLANNINNTTPPQPVLLPHPFAPSREKLAYASVSTAELSKLVSADVHFVDTIVRCGGRDCVQQGHEYAPLAQPTDFQSHWSYKYLLDLDGAGFSGRFLPFLASRSLPFKAALFREWYDSRLTPWQHFVPLDLRGHGFWATLVYFAGMQGKIKGRIVSLASHDKEAERIAESGREWAAQVLRKEDMEIYFFRLLLEWGRLTDDAREELGFTLAR